MNTEKHYYAPEKECLMDRARIAYASALSTTSTKHMPEKRHRCITFLNFFKMYQHGLGIKNNKGAQRFTKHQTDYLRDKFQEGERSGQKQDPIDVSKNMRHAIHNQGNKLFYSEEYLTAQQINSFFSREAK